MTWLWDKLQPPDPVPDPVEPVVEIVMVDGSRVSPVAMRYAGLAHGFHHWEAMLPERVPGDEFAGVWVKVLPPFTELSIV